MGRPFKGDLSHRPVLKKCYHCGNDVLKIAARSAVYKKAFCSKEHMIMSMKNEAFNFPCLLCGKPIYTQPAQLKLRARSTCSPICRRKLARKRVEAVEWRKSVFARDDYTCQFCKVRGTYLEADHIKPWAFFPDLRYELSNGRTLCRKCHDTTKISAKAMREKYTEAVHKLNTQG